MTLRPLLLAAVLFASACAPLAQPSNPSPAMIGQTAPPPSNAPPTSALAISPATTTNAAQNNLPTGDPCEIQAQQKIAAVQKEHDSDALVLLNPAWAIGLGPQLIKSRQDALSMIEQERQQCHLNVAAVATRQAQEARAREEEARNEEREQTHGYQHISFETFLLDGKSLAAKAAKVSLSGAYLREGNVDFLYVNQTDIVMANAPYGGDGRNHPTITLLSDDATREFRQHLLSCQTDPSRAQLGCPVTVLGTATICTLKNVFGVKQELPCVAVEDGR
jgi:hypothetical protein